MARITRLRQQDFFSDAATQIVMDRRRQDDVNLHGHEFAELVVILAGRAIHVTGAVRHEIRKGDVLFINSSRSHGYEETRNLELVNILIREDVFQEAEKELGSLPGYHALFTLEPMRWRQQEFSSHLRLRDSEQRQLVSWLGGLKDETTRQEEGGRLLARSWLMLILGLLARCYGRDAEDSPGLEMRLGRVLSWIDQNFDQPIRIARLAALAGMSERTFLRRFREATGSSPADYLIRTRIRRAAELLKRGRPRMTVTAVAFHCGFEDSNYFARQFRKITGRTPSDCMSGT